MGDAPFFGNVHTTVRFGLNDFCSYKSPKLVKAWWFIPQHMGVSGRRVATLCRWGYGIPPVGDLFTYCMGRPCIFGLQPCQACQSLGLTMLDICFKHRFVAFVLIHQICISIYIYIIYMGTVWLRLIALCSVWELVIGIHTSCALFHSSCPRLQEVVHVSQGP